MQHYFEWDIEKSNQNKLKHGINFNEGSDLWKDPQHVEILARVDKEVRFALIAKIEGIFWTAIFTKRKQYIRIISIRRSRKEEKIIYHG